MHPEEVRRRAKMGVIPGAKAGRAWVFLEDDLADWLRSLYAKPRQALQVLLKKEVTECPSTSARISGGSTLPHPTENEYARLLGLPIRPSPKNFTTS